MQRKLSVAPTGFGDTRHRGMKQVTKPPLENLFNRASAFLGSATPEVERRVKQMVQSTLSRMDLVTREEFDAQSKVLQHTRQRLEALERRLGELEESVKE